MAAGQMALDVLVRLRDLMSGPLRRLSGTVRGFTSLAGRIGVVGAAIAGISFVAPIAGAADFQQQLLDMAGTAELTGAAAFKFIDNQKTQFEDLALAAGQTSDAIASTVADMYAAGLDGALIDGAIDDIARVSTAANAAMNDIGAVATASMMTLDVPAEQIEKVLAMLTTAGKLGAFELKDMSKYIKPLASQVAKYGVKGQEAVGFLGAGLQVALKGASDPASAANNLSNFLGKILVPETIKNFKEMGVDIEAVMANAATKGINPIEAVLKKIIDLSAVSGDEVAKMMDEAEANGLEGAEALAQVQEQIEKIYGATALGELFADKQVMDFLIPFMANVDEYKSIRDKMADADSSVIGGDFDTQMDGMNRQLTTFREIGTQAAREVGTAFGEWLPQINGHLKDALKTLRAWNEETDGAVSKALSLGGAAVLLGGGLGVVGFALPAVIAGVKLLVSPVTGIAALSVYMYRAAAGTIALQAALATMSGTKLGWIGRILVGLRGMLFAIPGISWVAGGLISVFSAIGAAAAAVTAPVWGLIAAVVAAVAAIGIAVWRYWEPISNFISGFSEVIWNAVTDMMNALADFAGWVDSQVIDFYGMFGIDVPGVRAQLTDARGTVEEWWGSLKSWASGLDLWASIKSMFTMKDYSDDMEAGFRDAGAQAAQAMVDAVKGKIDELVNSFMNIGSRILAKIGKIDLSASLGIDDAITKVRTFFGFGGGGGSAGAQTQQMPPQPANSNGEVSASVDVNVSAAPGTTAAVTRKDVRTSGLPTGKAVGMP